MEIGVSVGEKFGRLHETKTLRVRRLLVLGFDFAGNLQFSWPGGER